MTLGHKGVVNYLQMTLNDLALICPHTRELDVTVMSLLGGWARDVKYIIQISAYFLRNTGC